jgi:hypothetical protein
MTGLNWIEPARNRNTKFLDQAHNYVQPEEGPGHVETLLLYSVHIMEFLICLYEVLHTVQFILDKSIRQTAPISGFVCVRQTNFAHTHTHTHTHTKVELEA